MKRSLRVFFLLLTLGVFLAACGGSSPSNSSSSSSNTTPSASPVTLNVFAAASLTKSFGAIKDQYTKAHPNVNITYNFNGSQLLAQQITSGAKADVFASADQANMQKVASLVNTPQVFVKNRITVIVPANNPANITSLKDLSRKGVKLDLAAPSVPIGKYALQVLDKLGQSPQYGSAYESAVKANVVSQEENVTSVVQKVQLGEADAGIVYVTDASSAAGKVKLIDIPDNFNLIAQYPIATTKSSANATAAQDFVNYVLSADGQAVLAKFGFITAIGSGS
jgi:molybdate transport system substrate-binding protein